MRYICARSGKNYLVIDMKEKKKHVLTKKEIIDNQKQGNIIDNINVYGNELVGRGYPIERFSDESALLGRVYIIGTHLKNGLIVSYSFLTHDGVYNKLNVDNAYTIFQKCGMVNANFVKGEIKDYNKSFKIFEEKTIDSYDMEDYLKLYKIYKKIGLSSESVLTDKYSSVFGVNFSYQETQKESILDSFIRSHKSMCIILKSNKIKIGYAYPIFERYSLGYVQDKYSTKCSVLFGYLIEFFYKNRKFQCIIPKEDKHILNIFSNRIEKKNKFIDLFFHEKDIDAFCSLKTTIEKTEPFNDNLKECIKNKIQIDIQLKDNRFQFKNEDQKIRNDIFINNMGFKFLQNELLN